MRQIKQAMKLINPSIGKTKHLNDKECLRMMIPKKVNFFYAELNHEHGILYVFFQVTTRHAKFQLFQFKTVVHNLVPSVDPDNFAKTK